MGVKVQLKKKKQYKYCLVPISPHSLDSRSSYKILYQKGRKKGVFFSRKVSQPQVRHVNVDLFLVVRGCCAPSFKKKRGKKKKKKKKKKRGFSGFYTAFRPRGAGSVRIGLTRSAQKKNFPPPQGII